MLRLFRGVLKNLISKFAFFHLSYQKPSPSHDIFAKFPVTFFSFKGFYLLVRTEEGKPGKVLGAVRMIMCFEADWLIKTSH